MAMVKKPFNGNLNTNAVYNSIYNMIMSQVVMAPRIVNNYGGLVAKFTKDAGMYGDTILTYDQDTLTTQPWRGHETEAADLLEVKRPEDPECQATTVDTYRMVFISVDRYLSKQAWSTANAFQQFTDNVLGQISKAKELQRTMMINVLIGTYDSTATRGTVEFDISSEVGAATGLEAKKLAALAISQGFSDLDVDLKDTTTDFNEYGFLRAYAPEDLIYVGNAKWLNKMTQDVRTIYHEAGMLDKLTANVLPARFFGHKLAAADLASHVYNEETNPDGELDVSLAGVYSVHSGVKTVRALDERDFADATEEEIHVRGGDTIPAGYIIEGGDCYIECPDIICKVLTKDSIKFLDGFSVETKFENKRGLIDNHYLIYGYSDPNDAEDQCVMKGQPFLTIEAE